MPGIVAQRAEELLKICRSIALKLRCSCLSFEADAMCDALWRALRVGVFGVMCTVQPASTIEMPRFSREIKFTLFRRFGFFLALTYFFFFSTTRSRYGESLGSAFLPLAKMTQRTERVASALSWEFEYALSAIASSTLSCLCYGPKVRFKTATPIAKLMSRYRACLPVAFAVITWETKDYRYKCHFVCLVNYEFNHLEAMFCYQTMTIKIKLRKNETQMKIKLIK